MYDFNCRSENEPTYVDSPTVDTKLQSFLQEIDILLSTEQGTVFGNRNFGADVERMLWSTTYNAIAIGVNIGRQIAENCLASKFFKWEADFAIIKGTSRDIGVLTINIKDIENETEIAKPQFVFK